MPEREHAIKSDVAFVSEDMAPYGGKSIAWNIDLVRSLSPQWDEARAATLLRRFELRPEQRTKGLSRGQTVRLLLLLALVRRPRLLLLADLRLRASAGLRGASGLPRRVGFPLLTSGVSPLFRD